MKELRRRNSKYKQKKEIKLFYLTKFGDMPSDSSLSTLNKEDISLLSQLSHIDSNKFMN